MEHSGEQLTCNLVHVGNHQQQTLRSGEGGGKCASLQRAVEGTSGTSLGLHLDNLYTLTEHILLTGSRPLINQLSHCRRGGDGVDSSYFAEHIGNVGSSVVTITSDKFLVFHLCLFLCIDLYT